jgi:hypothetical protein
MRTVVRVDHLHVRLVEPLLHEMFQRQPADLFTAKDTPHAVEYPATYQAVRQTRDERDRRRPDNVSQQTGGAVQLNIAQPDMPAASKSSTAIPITFLTITPLPVQTSIYKTACDTTTFGGDEYTHAEIVTQRHLSAIQHSYPLPP